MHKVYSAFNLTYFNDICRQLGEEHPIKINSRRTLFYG